MENKTHMEEFSDIELKQLADNKQLIDVRSELEYTEGHIPGAILFPHDQIEDFDLPNDRKYYFYCKSGARSLIASTVAKRNGYDVQNVEGGIVAYHPHVDN